MTNTTKAPPSTTWAGLSKFQAAVSVAIHELPDVNSVEDFLDMPGSATVRYHQYASTRESYALTIELGERAAYCLKVWRAARDA
jgi:hypothetical protein